MIDFPRAFNLAWARMIVILFQPFDSAKWPILGFNAFLVMLGEGNIQFNGGISFTQHKPISWNNPSLPTMIHESKQWVESIRALMEGLTSVWFIIFIAVGIAYIVGWLVLNWVGCRGEFLFIDNIVRNRAAIAEPWRRYAREGNIWFVFHLGLTLLTYILIILSAGIFLLVSWAWISQERSPQGGELAALAVFFIAFLLFWCIAGSLLFIIRSFVTPLLFRQTFGLSSALGAVIHLLFSHPLSMIVYVLASFVLVILGSIVSLSAVCVVFCCIFWLGFIPIIGSLLMTAILAQLLLPVLIYYRCFQMECLSQFGPHYDIWNVDVPPETMPGAASF